jgi:transcriptional regulator with XRE-family HTH domain
MNTPNLWEMRNSRDIKFVKAFGENLRRVRLSKKISQEYLADEANITFNQVSRIENGEVNTTIVTANALAKALGIKVGELFDFKY